MEYYNLMMVIGICIVYIATNIYSIVIYVINIIKNGTFSDVIAAPLYIFILLIPIIGSLFSLAVIDEDNKYWQLVFYTGAYLILIGFIINLLMNFQ